MILTSAGLPTIAVETNQREIIEATRAATDPRRSLLGRHQERYFFCQLRQS